MRIVKPTHNHIAMRQDLERVMRKHAEHCTPSEILAIAAQVCGIISALQDQRVTTSEQAMDIIVENVKAGNRLVIDNSKGSG